MGSCLRTKLEHISARKHVVLHSLAANYVHVQRMALWTCPFYTGHPYILACIHPKWSVGRPFGSQLLKSASIHVSSNNQTAAVFGKVALRDWRTLQIHTAHITYSSYIHKRRSRLLKLLRQKGYCLQTETGRAWRHEQLGISQEAEGFIRCHHASDARIRQTVIQPVR